MSIKYQLEAMADKFRAEISTFNHQNSKLYIKSIEIADPDTDPQIMVWATNGVDISGGTSLRSEYEAKLKKKYQKEKLESQP